MHITRFSVHRSGDNWILAYYADGGTRKRETLAPCSGLSKARAAEMATARVVALSHTVAQAGVLPLSLWLEQYANMRRGELAPATMAHIERTGRSLVAYFGATRDIATIARLEAAEWRLSLSRVPDHPKGGGRAPGPHVVSRHVVWAKLIFRVAHELDLIPFSPMDRLKIGSPATEQHWRYVSVEEAERLIAAAPWPTWAATIALARYAGLRRNEIEAFKWSDMDRLAAGRLLIHGDLDIRTTKKRTRECPISPRLREVLAQAHADMPHTTGPWEGGMDRNSERVIHAIIRAAEVAPYDKPLHTLRKSLETDWIDQHEIADVCQWLGNSPAVALKHYHRARPESFARVSQG